MPAWRVRIRKIVDGSSYLLPCCSPGVLLDAVLTFGYSRGRRHMVRGLERKLTEFWLWLDRFLRSRIALSSVRRLVLMNDDSCCIILDCPA